MSLLKQSLLTSPTIKKGEYRYIINPISDGIPQLSAELLNETADNVIKIINLKQAEVIVTIEAMGIPLATAISLKTGLPLNIIRKRNYGLNGEIKVNQQTGYSQNILYINGLKPGMKIIIIDCVISTGGTLTAVLNSLISAGVQVLDVACAYGKAAGKEAVLKNTGIEVKTLIDVQVDENGKVIETL